MHQPYFEGDRLMRGHGLGGMFASLFRRSIPFLKSIGLYTARNLKNVGLESLKEMSPDDKPKDILKKTARKFTGRVLTDLGSKLQGRGRKRKRKSPPKRAPPRKRRKKSRQTIRSKSRGKKKLKTRATRKQPKKRRRKVKQTTSQTFLY